MTFGDATGLWRDGAQPPARQLPRYIPEPERPMPERSGWVEPYHPWRKSCQEILAAAAAEEGDEDP